MVLKAYKPIPKVYLKKRKNTEYKYIKLKQNTAVDKLLKEFP